MNTDASGSLLVYIKGAKFTSPNIVIKDNIWHNLIISRSGTTGQVKIYYDGTLYHNYLAPTG